MLKHNLGYPRIGAQRQLKKASEEYWAGKITREELFNAAEKLREEHWKIQKKAGLNLIPCNDFSFYDQVLDMSFLLGVIPERYTPLSEARVADIDLYFAMARGYQKEGLDITAMEMTKWFDTNYHYIVPEFTANHKFNISSTKVFDEFDQARKILGKYPKPVLIGPISYLLLGKEKSEGFHRIDLIQKLTPIYIDLLERLKNQGAEWVQLDEPFLVLDLTEKEKKAFQYAYQQISERVQGLKILMTTYFDGLDENMTLAKSLPVQALHIDLVRAPEQLDATLDNIPNGYMLSLGVIDGRNIWKNDYTRSIEQIRTAEAALGTDRLMIAPSCSLLHIPFDLTFETSIHPDIKDRMAFARQKLQEIDELDRIILGDEHLLSLNRQSQEHARQSTLIHNKTVKQRVAAVTAQDARRQSPFEVRQKIQREQFQLPLIPTTTIGSFPQTTEIRQFRARFKKGEWTPKEYEKAIEKATIEAIRRQEEIGLDVLVHGEFERNDMVEYFGEQLKGFLSTQNGWVQSYGSRCVKPPVIYGDVKRLQNMTVRWSRFAQSQTEKPMKGMLTGPVTILQWSFVRDDQPRSLTTQQIAWAIRDEAQALEKAGIRIIQIDEPAIREGLPLKKKNWDYYLKWAVKAFKIASSGVEDLTQIHTHMCYSEFNHILKHIVDMDADVITIETSRSQMKLLEAFSYFKYPNEIGPGVYDIHSPRVPDVKEMLHLIEYALEYLPARNLWVNPDCGLKTRGWTETTQALKNMVQAAKMARNKLKIESPDIKR
ncbi:MAG: 5-methyltetrahydropteroyltriglutamate--homocysteine S-methyltransferase [Flavobacteriales bacterium Tduv]